MLKVLVRKSFLCRIPLLLATPAVTGAITLLLWQLVLKIMAKKLVLKMRFSTGNSECWNFVFWPAFVFAIYFLFRELRNKWKLKLNSLGSEFQQQQQQLWDRNPFPELQNVRVGAFQGEGSGKGVETVGNCLWPCQLRVAASIHVTNRTVYGVSHKLLANREIRLPETAPPDDRRGDEWLSAAFLENFPIRICFSPSPLFALIEC